MALHYKVAVNGQCVGQSITNVLYFGVSDGSDVIESIGAYESLAADIVTDIMPSLEAVTPSLLSYQNLTFSIVNGRNEPVSAFPYEFPLSGKGAGGGTIDGAGRCAILALKCFPHSPTQLTRVPKRSYLAVGPVTTESMDIFSALDSAKRIQLATLGAAIANFSANIAPLASPVVSTRVGVPNKDDLSSEGQVAIAIVRPNARNRNSRTVSATGS